MHVTLGWKVRWLMTPEYVVRPGGGGHWGLGITKAWVIEVKGWPDERWSFLFI